MEGCPQTRRAFHARWVFPVDSEPIENGTVEVEDGVITAVHARHDPAAHDLGNVAIIPGLVNAHTHFEFSDLSAPLTPATPFTAWLQAVVGHRRQSGNSPFQTRSAIRQGYAECGQCGTTLAGEIATDNETADLFSSGGPRVVLFRELLGLSPERMEEQLAIARTHLQQAVRSAPPGPAGLSVHRGKDRMNAGTTNDAVTTSDVIRGISPHAPYSVHPELFRQLVNLAAQCDAPLAIHLAETESELELLDAGTGEFVGLLKQFGVWQENVIPRGSRPLDYLQQLSALSRALVVHGNYLSRAEIAFLAEHRQLAVVYCPRTHHDFGHREHPWRELLDRGGSVAIGTDSRASNPDLSVWRELQFLHQRDPSVDPRQLLELGTIAGARALGLDSQTGSLTAGKSADMALISLEAAAMQGPVSQLLNPRNQVAGTMCAGRWIVEPQA